MVFELISSGIMRVRLFFIAIFIMSLKTVLQNIQNYLILTILRVIIQNQQHGNRFHERTKNQSPGQPALLQPQLQQVATVSTHVC